MAPQRQNIFAGTSELAARSEPTHDDLVRSVLGRLGKLTGQASGLREQTFAPERVESFEDTFAELGLAVDALRTSCLSLENNGEPDVRTA